jgi:hypothetical protein
VEFETSAPPPTITISKEMISGAPLGTGMVTLCSPAIEVGVPKSFGISIIPIAPNDYWEKKKAHKKQKGKGYDLLHNIPEHEVPSHRLHKYLFLQ